MENLAQIEIYNIRESSSIKRSPKDKLLDSYSWILSKVQKPKLGDWVLIYNNLENYNPSLYFVDKNMESILSADDNCYYFEIIDFEATNWFINWLS